MSARPPVLKAVQENADLAGNLSAAAHLIHGSSEGRFQITYCPGHLTREEIESVNFRYASLDEMTAPLRPGQAHATATTRWTARRSSTFRTRPWDCGPTAAGFEQSDERLPGC